MNERGIIGNIRAVSVPKDFPRTADGFKTWADAACTEWPMALTARAYNAWLHLCGHPKYGPVYLMEFGAELAEYRAANKG